MTKLNPRRFRTIVKNAVLEALNPMPRGSVCTTGKFSVKKLSPQTILTYDERTRRGERSPKHVTFAVIDASGEFVKDADGNYEIYPRKETASKVADHYNRTS